MKGRIPIDKASDVEKLKKDGVKCFVVLARYTSALSDEYALTDHSKVVGKINANNGYEGIYIEYADTQYAMEKENNMWVENVVNSNLEVSDRIRHELIQNSGRVYTNIVDAIKCARDHGSGEYAVPDGCGIIPTLIICTAVAKKWTLPHTCLINNRYNMDLVGGLSILEHVYTVDVDDERPWFPYPRISPDSPGCYFVTEEKDGDRFVARDARYYHGPKFIANDDRIVAWMPLPIPYRKGSFGEDKQ